MNRTEIKGIIQSEGATLSNAKLIEILAKEMKAEPELIVIKKIKNQFGKKTTDFSAVAYHKKEDRKAIEPVTKFLKTKAEEAKKKAAEAKKEGEQ